MSETLAKDCKQEDSTNDKDTLIYKTTKPEKYANIVNGIKENENELDLDKMEEFLSENVDKTTIVLIKEEGVDEMEEFLPEDSPSFYSPLSPTWKSDDRTEVITHDVAHHRHVKQQHLTSTITQQISLPKIEIIDMHTDEDDIKGLEFNGDTDANVSVNKERSIISSSRVATEHKCELCGNSYTDKQGLHRHMKYKHPLALNAEYICEKCNQKFTTQAGLHRHYYWTHRETQKTSEHKCEICGSCYRESVNLRAHIRNKHPSSIDTEYICDICSQRFNTKSGLVRHSTRKHPEANTTNRTNSTQPPTEYKCEICGSSFTEFNNLRTHIRNKHPSSIDTEYSCEVCKQRFYNKIGLVRHSIWMHPEAESTPTRTKYKCELCPCSYTEDKTLQQHIRKKHPSSIDTEYICEICNRPFTTQKGLAIHSYLTHPETQTPAEHK
ncbi:uncharacterized protein isoform X3 [Musca autumnalis]|uniref:uncharacterized protein isoform X3 n=1 Tax=Musca autumnalis TaxID=221902 RepID=UPI003CF82D25